MRTRSTFAKEILEERQKRRSQRKERELEELLLAAGSQRPKIELFDDSPIRRTRNQIAKSASILSTVQVVIHSQPREHYPTSPSTSDRRTESFSEEASTVETPGSGSSHSGTATLELDALSTEQPLESTEKSTEIDPQSPPPPAALLKRTGTPNNNRAKLDRRTKKQLRVIRYSIKQTLRHPCKTNLGILKGLKRAERKLWLRAVPLPKLNTTKSYEPPVAAPILFLHGPVQIIISPAVSQDPPVRSDEGLDSSRLSPPKRLSSAKRRRQAPPTPNTWKKLSQIVDHIVSPINMAVEPPSQDEESQIFELTDKCHHYTKLSEVEYDIQKYWQQRYSIWSWYDEGIYMTDDAWFGVTPEPVANKVAEDFAALVPSSKTILIDMFAGAGGNVIAFALSERWTKIIAIEKDPSVIACAQHNAAVYGVAEYITWINDDSFAYLSKHASSIDSSQTVIFASPPWGGPRYEAGGIYNLNMMQPYGIKEIYEAVKTMDSALYLPRGSDLRQIARLAPEEKKIEVVQYCMEGASKAMVAYIPAASPAR